MRGVDAVLLDLGNVLVTWDWTAALAGTLTDEELERFAVESDFRALNVRLDAGLPWADAVAELAARDPWLGWVLEEYRLRYAQALTGPVPGMADLVAELRAQGLRLVGLTDWAAETYPHAVPAAPAIGLLDGVVVSGIEGVTKPDARIFRIAIERFDLDPDRTLFVDDAPVNVAGAREVGLDAVRFTGVEDLRRELVARGIPVRVQ